MTEISSNHKFLSEINDGNECVVVELMGGSIFKSRMISMGIIPGTILKVLQNYGHGPILVEARGTKIALGREEAQKVYVKINSTGST